AALAANTLADVYVEQNLARKQSSTRNMITWLDGQSQVQKQLVADSQRNLGDYREKQNALSLDEKQNMVVDNLAKYNDDAVKAKRVREQKEVVFEQLQDAMKSGGPVDSLAIITQNPTITNYKTTLQQLQRERTALLEKYKDSHPAVKENAAKIGETEKQ